MSVDGLINFITPQNSNSCDKPYQLKYEPPDDFPATNIVSKEHSVKLEDVRGRETDFNIQENGFAVVRLDDSMAYEDYDDETSVHRVYFKQVAEAVRELLGASRVQIFEHILRKRHAQFPVATGKPYHYNQPTNTAHIDVTPLWATGLTERMNATAGIELPSENFQFVNIWKPLRGPIKDWPLAVCDSSSLERTDLRESDIVFSDRVIENYLIQHNSKQKWYYLSDQQSNEAWIFLQSSSETGGPCGSPHSSFLHPDHSSSQQPRESIEVRAIAYY